MTATDPFDADRLDTWLEGNPFPSTSLNGHSDTQADLAGTAQRFHADAGKAERGLPVPTRAIWEDVMQRTAGLQISPPDVTTTSGDGGHRPPPAMPHRPGTSGPPPQRGLWITTASLIVVAMFAIAAVAYLADRSSDNPSGITNSPETPNLAANFSSSPESGSNTPASPSADGFEIITPDQIDCSTIERRSNDEILELQSDPGEFPDRSYGPTSAASEQDALAIAAIDPYVSMCDREWRSLASPRLISDAQATGYPYGLFPDFYLDQGMTLDDLVSLLQTLVAESGVTDASEILIPTDAPDSEDSWYAVINPDHVRLFPDGRLGALQTWVIPASFGTNQEAYQTSYVFYMQDPTQDGTWVLDEMLQACVGECDEYWAGIIDGSIYSETPQPNPGATPAASPEADDSERWLVDPDNVDCVRADPYPLTDVWPGRPGLMLPGDYLPFAEPSSEDQVAVAARAQELIVGCDLGDEPFISEDFTAFDSPYGDPVTQQQLDTAQALSEAVQTGDLMDYIVVADEPRENDFDGDLYSFSRRTLLPDSIMLLPDGRLGGTLTAVLPSSESRDEIATYVAERGQIEPTFLIFEQQGDAWVLDEAVMLCLGDCADWWAMYQLTVETPSAATPDATPIAVDESEWLIDPEKIECNRSLTTWEGTRSFELPGTRENYLPFEPATEQVQEEVARTYQLLTGMCFEDLGQEQPFADVLWFFPLRTDGLPVTQDELDIARSISETVNTGNALDFVHATDGPIELIQPNVSHFALLPSRVVKLPDGRYAAPFDIVFEANSREQLESSILESGGSVVSRLVVFAPVADGYVIEGYLPICLGNCDGYWDTYEIADATEAPGATPEASPEADDGITLDPEATYVDPGFWLLPEYPGTPQPAGPDGSILLPALPPSTETPEPWTELVGSPAADTVERWLVDPATIDCIRDDGDVYTLDNALPVTGESWDYLPVQTATEAEAIAVAESFQLIGAGCDPEELGYPLASASITSFPQLVEEVPVATAEQVALMKMLSGSLGITAEDLILEAESLPDDPTDPSWFTTQPVLLAEHVVTLPDGRLGAPLTWYVRTSHPEGVAGIREELGEERTSLVFMIFTLEDNRAVLDEILQLCTGDCDDFWASIQIVSSIDPSTPVTSASPAVDIAYEPITAEECEVAGLSSDEVSAIVADPGEEPERSYVPVGPAGASDASAALEADRAWVACSTYGSIGQRAVLQTPWLTATGPESDPNLVSGTVDDIIEIIEERRPLSEGMLSDDELVYVVPSGQAQVEMIESLGGPSVTLPHPATAYVLDDGRIAIPQIRFEADDSYIFSDDYESPVPFFVVPVHIMALDPESQLWLVDEVIWLTGGNVDERITMLRELEAEWLEQAGLSPATPEATPAGGS